MTTSPGIPPPPLRLGNTSAAGGGLRPGQQPTVETASPLAGLDLDCTRLALPIARAARRPLLPRQRQPIAGQADCAQLATGNA